MCCYASFLADEGLAPQMIKSYLSALRNMQLSLGFPDPREQSSLPMLKQIQAGIARCRLLRDPPSRICLPITAHILRKIGQGWRESLCPERAVLWAVACSAFFVFFRLGELLPATGAAYNPRTSLSWGDVAVDSLANPRMVQFHLRRSKCDQAGMGADVVVGKTGSDVCPVTAILEFIELWGSLARPFFLDSAKKPVLKPWFVAQLREALCRIGFPPMDFAGHSFRIGAATTLVGLEDRRWGGGTVQPSSSVSGPQSHLVCLTGTSPSTLNLDRCVSPIIVSVINDVQVVRYTQMAGQWHT